MANEMKKSFNFMIYRSAEENVSVNALIKDDTIWLTQKALAELLDCTSNNVGLHLKSIYSAGELEETATTEEILVVQKEGARNVKRKASFYNLDAIISVDITKGFALDDDRNSQVTSDFDREVKKMLGGKK